MQSQIQSWRWLGRSNLRNHTQRLTLRGNICTLVTWYTRRSRLWLPAMEMNHWFHSQLFGLKVTSQFWWKQMSNQWRQGKDFNILLFKMVALGWFLQVCLHGNWREKATSSQKWAVSPVRSSVGYQEGSGPAFQVGRHSQSLRVWWVNKYVSKKGFCQFVLFCQFSFTLSSFPLQWAGRETDLGL